MLPLCEITLIPLLISVKTELSISLIGERRRRGTKKGEEGSGGKEKKRGRGQ